MANNSTSNPMQIDTEGVVFSGLLQISSIILDASADNWSCILTDSNDEVIFRASSAITGHRSVFWQPTALKKSTGLKAQTLTNIEQVLVFID